MANARKQLAQQYSVHSRIKNRQPVHSPTEDSLPPRITRKLVSLGYNYNGSKNAWIFKRRPILGKAPTNIS